MVSLERSGRPPGEGARHLGHTRYRDAGAQLPPRFPTFLTAAVVFGCDAQTNPAKAHKRLSLLTQRSYRRLWG